MTIFLLAKYSYFLSFLCEYRMHVNICVQVHTCRGQGIMLGVFLYYWTFYAPEVRSLIELNLEYPLVG